MNEVYVDWLAVVVAAALNMLIGFVWYSKRLFGPIWMKHHARAPEGKPTAKTLLYAGIASLVTAYFIAFFEGYVGVTTVSDGMVVGFCLWLGFVATTQVNAVLWEKAPFQLFLVHTGSKLLSFLVMGGVIGA